MEKLLQPSLKEALGKAKTSMQKFLGKAFEYEVDGVKFYTSNQNVDKIKKVIARLAKSEDGKKALENAHQEGYKINFFWGGSIAPLGAFDLTKKSIILNNIISDDAAVAILAHELRHGQQKANSFQDASPAVVISYVNIKEADAEAFAVKCSWQLKQQGDDKVWQSLLKDRLVIARAFAKSQYSGEALDVSLTKAFSAWFDVPQTKDVYDERTVDYYQSMICSKELDATSKSPTVKDLIDKTCSCGGKNYFKGDYNDPIYMCISPRNMFLLERTFAHRTADNVPQKFKEGLSLLQKNNAKIYGQKQAARQRLADKMIQDRMKNR